MPNTPVKVLIEQLEGLKAKGIESISLQDLLAHLHEFEKSDYTKETFSAYGVEKIKAEWSVWASTVISQRIEMFRAVITAGQAALKSSILINGGAAVAVFAFMGNALARQSPTFPVSEFAWSAFAFIIGVLFSAIASGCTYLAQWFYSLFTWESKRWQRITGHIITFLTWVLVVLSFISFFCGALSCYHALSKASQSSLPGM